MNSKRGDGFITGLGQSWSTPEVSLEVVNHVKLDVGFLSYPFVQKLILYVF